jgi:hypothetical protein
VWIRRTEEWVRETERKDKSAEERKVKRAEERKYKGAGKKALDVLDQNAG